MTVRRIYLIRHGQSTSQTGTARPDDVDPPLSPRGRNQARRLRSLVTTLGAERVLISTMRRAWQTCALSGITAPRLEFDSRLIESEWGNRTLYRPLVGTALPSFAQADRQQAVLTPVRRRCASLLADLLDAPDRTTVLFGHWGVFAHLFQSFFRIPASARPALNSSDNASVSLLEIEADGSRRLRYWNERAHLGRLHLPPFW